MIWGTLCKKWMDTIFQVNVSKNRPYQQKLTSRNSSANSPDSLSERMCPKYCTCRQKMASWNSSVDFLDSLSEQMCPKYCTCQQKMASRNSSADSLDSLSEQMCPKYRTCWQKMASWNSPADPADPPEMQSSGAGHTLGSTRAGGHDDGSLHKLPEIILNRRNISKFFFVLGIF